MRFRIVFLTLFTLAVAVPRAPALHAADQDHLRRQQDIIYLLENISGGLLYARLQEIGVAYEIESQFQNYENPSVVRYYVGLVRSGHVQPRGTPFSTSVSQLRKEAALLTQILLGAKDYETFLNTAAWARVHVNEDQFVTAFASAVLQRQDLNGIILPPVYEVYPQYFFDARIIQKVFDHVNKCNIEGSNDQSNVYNVNVNYTSNVPQGENQISYFTDDIGLSAYYFYVQLASYMLPKESNAVNFKHSVFQQESREDVYNGHGARYYYIHQQLLARYNLERLAQRLSPVKELDSYYEHIETPYRPNLRYSSGVDLPSRNEHIHITSRNHNYKLVRLVSSLERRILDAINLGHVITSQGTYVSLYQPEGLSILANLIEGTGRSINPRFYGSFQAVARQLFGNAPAFNNIFEYSPSVLELGQTAVRDPVFYELYNKIIKLFHYYQESLPAYQYNDVVAPGVNIQKVDVSDLITYFSNFEVSLDNAVGQSVQRNEEDQSTSRVKAHLKRLDHRQYEYTIYVNSEKVLLGAVVRIYLGPKYNYNGQPIDISVDRQYFYELDQFSYDLVEGQNVIVRNSQEATGQSFDLPSIQQLKNKVHGAIRSENPHYVNYPEQLYGFPERLSLPKGSKSGFPMQFLIVISSRVQQQPESYGPVVEEEWMTYQPQHYRLIRKEDYEDNARSQKNKVNFLYQNTEVIPNFEDQSTTSENGNWGYLYKRYPGSNYYPHWQQTYYKIDDSTRTQQQGTYGYLKARQGHQQNTQYFVNGYEPNAQSNVRYNPINQGVSSEQRQTSSYGTGEQQASNRFHSNQQSHQGIDRFNKPVQHPGVYRNTEQVEDYSSELQARYVSKTYQNNKGHDESLHPNRYQNTFIGNIIGGAISLDGRPLGYPLNRKLTDSALYARNIHVQDVLVYHIDDNFSEY